VPVDLDLVADGEINILDVQAVVMRVGCGYFDDCYWPEVLAKN